jgi:hypothetical protein
MADDGVCPDIANHRSRVSCYGVSTRTPRVGLVPTPLYERISAQIVRRKRYENDVEDIPMVYLLYVLLAIVLIVGIAAVMIIRLITA